MISTNLSALVVLECCRETVAGSAYTVRNTNIRVQLGSKRTGLLLSLQTDVMPAVLQCGSNEEVHMRDFVSNKTVTTMWTMNAIDVDVDVRLEKCF